MGVSKKEGLEYIVILIIRTPRKGPQFAEVGPCGRGYFVVVWRCAAKLEPSFGLAASAFMQLRFQRY